MKHYLTNTLPSNKERCIQAAQRSGLPITFEAEPMPESSEFPHYSRNAAIKVGYGCVVLNGPDQDCSKFWREWDAFEGSKS